MDWLWQADRALQQAINRGFHSDGADRFFRFVTYFGLDQVLVPLIAAMIFYRPLRKCGVACFVSYAVSGLLSAFVKHLLVRWRPGAFLATLLSPDEQIYMSSFPSGHATIAFAFAFGLLINWPGPKRMQVGIAALIVAFLVGVSRIYRGVHWPTDALGGMLLGFIGAVCATVLLRLYRKAPNP